MPATCSCTRLCCSPPAPLPLLPSYCLYTPPQRVPAPESCERQAVAALREEDLLLLGVLPGHARRILLRVPTLLARSVGARDCVPLLPDEPNKPGHPGQEH